MADVSALLAQYLSVKSQVSYNQLQSTKWADLHEAMSAKLSRQTKAEDQWISASDVIVDSQGQKEIKDKNGKLICSNQSDKTIEPVETNAIAYANWKVPEYDPEKLDEYAELDMQYDLMQTTYETLLEQLNTQAESLKTTLGNATKDTGMLDA